MKTTQAALEAGAKPIRSGACRRDYLVFEDGRVLAARAGAARRAYHAGESSWEGTTDINSRSVGIEIGNQGHDFGCPEFPQPQMAAVIALCQEIVARWLIAPWHVLAHSDVAPLRKRDPGEAFPWARLAAAGVGLWVEPAPIERGHALCLGDQGEEVAKLQRVLAEYGYGVTPSGHYDAETHEIVAAFQRHFRPARVDGVADVSTMRTLESLLAQRKG